MIPTWIGPLIGLISLSLAVTFFVLARRARLKGPTWAIRSNNLVRGFGSRLPELEILFRKNKVDTLTVSRIAVWNRGAATIDCNDIAAADPLRISPAGSARLLDAKLAQVSGDSSQFNVVLTEDGAAAYLRFDFLDRDHGAVVQVIHTGASGDDLSVVGTIKGAGTPVKRKIRAYMNLPAIKKFEPRIRRRITSLVEFFAITLVVVTASAFFVSWLFPSQWAAPQKLWDTFQKTHSFLGGLLPFVTIGLVYISSLIVLALLLRPALPVGLMSFVDDPLEQ